MSKTRLDESEFIKQELLVEMDISNPRAIEQSRRIVVGWLLAHQRFLLSTPIFSKANYTIFNENERALVDNMEFFSASDPAFSNMIRENLETCQDIYEQGGGVFAPIGISLPNTQGMVFSTKEVPKGPDGRPLRDGDTVWTPPKDINPVLGRPEYNVKNAYYNDKKDVLGKIDLDVRTPYGVRGAITTPPLNFPPKPNSGVA